MTARFFDESWATAVFIQWISRANNRMHEVTSPFVSLQIESMATHCGTDQLKLIQALLAKMPLQGMYRTPSQAVIAGKPMV